MKRTILYFDTSSLINLVDTDRILPDQIKNKYDVFLSLLNFFEVVVYENDSKKIRSLEYFEEFKGHLPLDLPTSIIERFLTNFAANEKRTRWSITGHKYPEWNDSNNIFLIKNYLKKEKKHFKVTNTSARTFLTNNKMNTNDPTVQDSLSYLDYLFSQDNILERIFNSILFIQPKLNFSYQIKIDLMKSLELICFFVPWLLGHHRLAMKNSHYSPKKNPDSIDIAHSFYMGACDVFITDDEQLHSLLDDFNRFKYFNSYKQVKILTSNQLLNSL